MKITLCTPAWTSLLTVALIGWCTPSQAAIIGYSDVVLDYFDSGVGPIFGPYGGEFPGGIGFPVPVSTSVVVGDDPGPNENFLSLPTGSYVTVGFTDETVIDGVGNDIFITEIGASGEQANVFVSADLVSFTLLGVANDSVTTAFDLGSIGFSQPVQAVKIVGLDALGGSPGFDVVNVRVLPGSIGPPPVPDPATVPEPTTFTIWGLGFLGYAASARLRKHPRI